MSIKTGRILRSKVLRDEFRAKEMSRRAFIRRASAAGAGGALVGGLPGCGPEPDPEPDPEPVNNYLVGLGSGDGYKTALENAMNETVARDGLAGVVNSGDTVYLKVNSNSGDWYPYSTPPRMVEEVAQWCWDQGAGRVIVGDRSFWGDPFTYSNLEDNGMVDAAEAVGAELVVFDNSVDWVEIEQGDAPDWNGGFRFPLPVVQSDVIINLPIVKTHFISTFTMGMKNIIGLVNADDRQRAGNLDFHITSGNKLYRQIAQLNQHITPTLTFLDGWEAVIQGGPTVNDGPGGETGEPGVMIVSTDRIAADVTGLAVLKNFATDNEDVHDYDVWENPQIVEAVEAGVGIQGPDEYEASGPTVENLSDYLDLIV